MSDAKTYKTTVGAPNEGVTLGSGGLRIQWNNYHYTSNSAKEQKMIERSQRFRDGKIIVVGEKAKSDSRGPQTATEPIGTLRKVKPKKVPVSEEVTNEDN